MIYITEEEYQKNYKSSGLYDYFINELGDIMVVRLEDHKVIGRVVMD